MLASVFVMRHLVIATVREAIRAKLLYVAAFLSVMIVVSGSLLGSIAIGNFNQVVKDFGLFAVSIVSVSFTILTGSSLLSKELTQKTIYNIMSKPIYRWQFVVGKFLALFIIGAGLIFITGSILVIYISLIQASVDWSLAPAFIFMAFEIMLIAAITIFFSSIVVTPFLNGLFAISLFIVGRSANYLKVMADETGSPLLRYLYCLVPRFDSLWIGDGVIFGLYPDASLYFYSFLYVVLYSMLLIMIATIFFNNREFN